MGGQIYSYQGLSYDKRNYPLIYWPNADTVREEIEIISRLAINSWNSHRVIIISVQLPISI
jgi:hypothetical protein